MSKSLARIVCCIYMMMVSQFLSVRHSQLSRKSLSLIVAGLSSHFRSVSSLSSSTMTRSLLQNKLLLPDVNINEVASFEVRNPAEPDSVVGYAPIMGGDEAKESIERAHNVLASWRDCTTAQHRATLLQKWSRLIKDNSQDIATIMTLESGKPLQESQGEVAYGTSFLDYFAAEAIRPTGAGGGFLVPTPFMQADASPRGQVMAIQQAVGVTALITPWNFPIAMITRKVGPALAAGCTAVVKPSELTPLTAMALQTLADQAGIPPGVLQLVTAGKETTPDVGYEFCTNPLVQKISFTGSTAVGKKLMKLSSDTVKRLSLELGGNAPFVVFEDADLDQAVASAIASKFRNAGQTCVCADRFLVHASVHDEFVLKLTEAVKGIRVGPGMEDSTSMGPLISSDAVQNIADKVEEAVEEAAECVFGGSSLEDIGTHFYEPTVLTNVTPDSRVWKMETFGPVAPIAKFETEEEALQLANDASVGLASYFCTQNLSRAFRFAQRIESGIVGVNEGIVSTCNAPFGGVKQSGLGREGSPIGISEYLETKYIFMNV